MTLSHGIYYFVGKSHTVNAKGVDKYIIKYEDDRGNKWSAVADAGDFEAARIDSTLDITEVGKQTTLD